MDGHPSSTPLEPIARRSRGVEISALLAFLVIALWWLLAAYLPGWPDGNLRAGSPVEFETGPAWGVSVEPLGEAELPVSARQLVVGGGVLYAAMSYGGLATLDLSDPGRPRPSHIVTGVVDNADPSRRMILSVLPDKDRLLVCDRHQGLVVYDAADPLRPVPKWNIPFSADPNRRPVAAARVGESYYLSCGGAGLLSLPADFGPTTVPRAVISQYDHTRQAVPFGTNHLLVADGYDTGMQILRLAGRSGAKLVHHFQTGTFCDSIIPIGDHAVMANRKYGFVVADLRDPSDPLVASYLYTPAREASSVKAMALWRGRYLVVGNHDRGLRVYDLADPARPRAVFERRLEAPINTMTLDGDMLYVGYWERNKIGVLRLVEEAGA